MNMSTVYPSSDGFRAGLWSPRLFPLQATPLLHRIHPKVVSYIFFISKRGSSAGCVSFPPCAVDMLSRFFFTRIFSEFTLPPFRSDAYLPPVDSHIPQRFSSFVLTFFFLTSSSCPPTFKFLLNRPGPFGCAVAFKVAFRGLLVDSQMGCRPPLL